MRAAALAVLLLAPAARGADCVAPGSLPALLDQAEAMTPAERRGLDLAAFLTPAVYWHACAGLAGRGAAACAELAGRDLRVPGARALDWNCRHRMDEAAFIRALARREPDAAEACARIVGEQMGVSDAKRVAALCAEVAAGGAAADDALCRELAAAAGREATERRLKGCRNALSLYRGEAADCEAMGRDDYLAADLPLCRAAKALRAGDCGGDPLCLALSGGSAAVCAPFEAAAKAAFAARRTAPDDRPAALGPEGAPRLSYADDVAPRAPEFEAPGASSSPARGGGRATLRREAFPEFAGGALRLPRLYGEGKDYAPADRAALLALLPAFHHLFDVNVAYAEGYRRAPELDSGAERVLALPGGGADPAKPPYLRYVADRASGLWQLVRVGFTADPKAPPGPRGPFVAAGVYNRAGLYAPAFPDAAVLASGVRTFFGARPPAPRKPRPLCPPAPATRARMSP